MLAIQHRETGRLGVVLERAQPWDPICLIRWESGSEQWIPVEDLIVVLDPTIGDF